MFLYYLVLCLLQGSLDIVVTAKEANTSAPQLLFLNSDIAADVSFLKVTGEH